MKNKELCEKLYKMSTKVQDYCIVSRDNVIDLVKSYKLSLDDISDMILQNTEHNIYFDYNELKKYKPMDYILKIQAIKSKVLSRLPSFLNLIVKDIPINYVDAFDSDFFVYEKNYSIKVCKLCLETKTDEELENQLGMVYWSAFCHLVELDGEHLFEDVGNIASGELKVPDMEPFHKRQLFKDLENQAKQNKMKAMLTTIDKNDLQGIGTLVKFLFAIDENCKK